jgi:hypothetical protein
MLRGCPSIAFAAALLAACGSTPSTDDEPDAPAEDADTGGGDAVPDPDGVSDADADSAPDLDSPGDAQADLAEDPGSDADAVSDSSPDADTSADADTASDADTAFDGDTGPDVDPDPLAACADRLLAPPAWPEAPADLALPGAVELAQTHVVGLDETRIAPRLQAGRGALLLFTPEVSLPSETALLVRVVSDDGASAPLALAPPEALPTALEQDLTDVALTPYSDDAWSARLPWSWLDHDAAIEIAWLDGDVRHVHVAELPELAPDHTFTVTRTHTVLFGEPDFDPSTLDASRLARDYFPALPASALRVVDALPWRLDAVVARTATGPQLVSSEAEWDAVSTDSDHWVVIKNQMALRLSLANTGRGLTLTELGQGDSSPYSFGTSVVMGYFRDTDGSYRDLDDAPWAAGWTGWTAMWAGECGNAFIHEVGHSLTLAHFTDGTATSWGIADEYPRDGTFVAAHPWGFDSLRGRFRTWYRVGAAGPALEGDAFVGKRDPMNGGEASDAVSCFPPYTPYHARQAQQWMVTTPSPRVVDGAARLAVWNADAGRYVDAAPGAGFQDVVAVDVPVVTIVGTMARTDAASVVYPPVYLASGNVFANVDPSTAGLPAPFAGARFVLEVEYADGAVEHSLIARAAIADNTLALFSRNLDARREPVRAALLRTDAAYPGADPAEAEVVFERVLAPPGEPLAPVVEVGHGLPGVASVTIERRCEPGFDCDRHEHEVLWETEGAALGVSVDGVGPDASACGTEADSAAVLARVVDADGNEASITLRAQRVVRAGTRAWRAALGDETPWATSPDTREGFVVRAELADNPLAPGRWRSVEPVLVTVAAETGLAATIEVHVDIEVRATTDVDLRSEWVSPGVTTSPASSIYFVTRDAAIGPTGGVWWDDGIGGTTLLRVPVRDAETGAYDTLYVDAWNVECGTSSYDMNAGRVANDCPHSVRLRVDAARNAHLAAGHAWRTPPTSPLALRAVRWHQPGAGTILADFDLAVTYTP